MRDSDHQLLRDFRTQGSSQAFEVLIARHLGLVHSTAKRVTGNDEAARDISQTVFLKLVRKAARIPADLPLAAWFHRETHNAAVDHVRMEIRRQQREKTAVELDTMNAAPDLWKELAPVIDGAVEELSSNERALVLLRFYENKTHPEIAHELGISEDAARMRSNRALESLRGILRNRGITTTAAALALTLPAHAINTPPAALAASISTAALAGGISASTTLLTPLIAMTKSQLTAIAAIAVAIPVISYQFNQNTRLKDEQATLRSTIASHERTSETRSNSVSKRSTTPKRSVSPSSASLQDILSTKDPVSRIDALLAYASTLSADQIPGVLDALRKGSPEWDPEVKMLTHILLTRWAQSDPDAAYATLATLDFKKGGGDATSILSSLAALDPTRAAAWLSDPDNALANYPWMGQILAGTVAKEWVRQDPDAALAWAASLPASQRAGAYSGVLGSLATSDPKRASTIAMNLPADGARTHIVGEIAQAWARNSPAEALAWAQSLAGADRQSSTDKALGAWAQNSPREAASYLSSIAGNQKIDSFLPTIASAWAPQAPTDTANWLSTQPESGGKARAMGAVAYHWTSSDPAAAASWIGDQPASPSRDGAIMGLSKVAFDQDPANALNWASQITDQTSRERSVQTGFSEWQKRDPQAAEAWQQQNGGTQETPSK